MTIKTRDFGTLELDENAVVEFRTPIFGFEDLKRFVLLSDDETGPGFLWLQSLEDPEVCFVLLDPDEIGLDYTPVLPQDAVETLQLEGDPIIRLIAVIPMDFQQTTVNMKSPVVINPENRWGSQVILDADYPIRHRLFGEEGTSC